MRQDYLIGSGLVPQFAAAGAASPMGEGDWFGPVMRPESFACDYGALPDLDYLADLNPSADAVAMSLARVRQLAAHETGHTLGFAHNFAASTYGRASVMDYPAPKVGIKDGHLDLSDAYTKGIGAFDKFAVTYAYAQFPPGRNEEEELQKILASGVAAGMLFISDEDARPAGAAHPLASLWDNGPDPVASLRHEMEVRRIGLEGFGIGSIPNGTPMSMLEAKLLPLYLHHRYQLQAAVKSLGGVFYTYAVKTAGTPLPAQVMEIVPADRQRDALAAVLETLKVDQLQIPARILALIPPRAFGYGGPPTELFDRRTDLVFDPIAAATIAADLAVSGLLQPERAARLMQFHARNDAYPDFDEVVRSLLRQTWYCPAEKPMDNDAAAILQAVQDVVVTRLMDVAGDASASPAVRAVAEGRLRNLSDNLRTRASSTLSVGVGMSGDHLAAVQANIERFLARPDAPYRRTVPPVTPPGDPIGGRVKE